MTLRLTKFGGTNWEDDQVLSAADQNSTIIRSSNEPWYIGTFPTNFSGTGLIKFSDTIWQTTSARSTDAGVTWSVSITSGNFLYNSGAAGIAVTDGGAVKYTTDSGATWNSASVAPANVTSIQSIGMGSTTVAVLVGQGASGESIWYSSDGGDNWAQAATGPGATEQINTLIMVSATVGYASVQTQTKIWKTTDGGANWSDTTHAKVAPGHGFIVGADDIWFTGLISNFGILQYINSTGAQNTLVTINNDGITGADLASSNIVQATNGNYYWLAARGFQMMVIKYDGTDIYTKSAGPTLMSAPLTAFSSSGYAFLNLIEVSNVLYYNNGTHLRSIDVSDN